MVKKAKKEIFEDHQLNLNETVVRLELNSGHSRPSIAFTSSNQIPFREVMTEFVLILYGKMTLEISCRSVHYIENRQILIVIFDDNIQLVKIDPTLNYSSCKTIVCTVTADCIISIVKDIIVISRLGKIISYSKLPK